MRIKLFLLLFLSASFLTFSQGRVLSESAEISVLTVGPGKLLNDSFGHNAFRINDKASQTDLVFNYGVYDFGTPNFYTKFAQGKLNYKMGLNYYKDFYNLYTRQDRTIKEQVLNLTNQEKQQLFDYLVNNYKPENRYYLYDFFFDNCATKMRDVLEISLDNDITFNTPDQFEPKTFRSLIHDHVDRNTWGSFGIDLALGSVIDKEATPYEHMYLPKYINVFFESATRSNGDALVKSSNTVYSKRTKEASKAFFMSPLFILGLVALVLVWITYRDHKRQKRTKWVDITLFGFTGIIGIIVLLLWFATDHTATSYNYNLLWAFPINLFVIGQLFRNRVKNWFRKYIKFLIIILVLLTLHWLIGVQIYALGLIPILIAVIIRYVFLNNYFKVSALHN